MQTRLADFVKQRPEHREMEDILRACVHCGFCNATCPTYQLLGDERDGPRGRIYLLKQVLEGQAVSSLTETHLDRCLSCRSCETTCPSGVRYGRLLDLGRVIVEEKVSRSGFDRLRRYLLRQFLPYRRRVQFAMAFAWPLRGLLPNALAEKIPQKQAPQVWPESNYERTMLVLAGCVQPVLMPSIDAAVAKVLGRLGISLLPVEGSGCCGALPYHLSAHEQAKKLARRNIDACWPHLQQGAEVVVSTASGCGINLKEYRVLLYDDPAYRDKARYFAERVKDIGEVLADEDLSVFKVEGRKIAFHSPCSLQHGQGLSGLVEGVLEGLGYQLTSIRDGHLCCGSAGVYSLLQTDISERLRQNKLKALLAGEPEVIATANVGCLLHLQAGTHIKIKHWLELLNEQE